jgi:hypothetical protein
MTADGMKTKLLLVETVIRSYNFQASGVRRLITVFSQCQAKRISSFQQEQQLRMPPGRRVGFAHHRLHLLHLREARMKGERIVAYRYLAAILFALVLGSNPAWGGSTPLLANHPAETATFQPVGSPNPATPLVMEITFGLRNRGALDQLIADQQNPSSPYYHRWLSGAEFENSFGPTPRDFNAVAKWLSSQGFVIMSADPRARSIIFSGPADLAEHSFGTRLGSYGDGAVRQHH